MESSTTSIVFDISCGAQSIPIPIHEGKANTDGISQAENFILATPVKKEGKIYARYTPSSLLGDVKGLLATGLLEGLRVKYKKDEVEISGVVQDLGYKCGCSSCNYTKVVSAREFETHAGVTSNNPNNHIFLDNGKTIYALVKDLRNVPLGSVGELIEEKIGCPANVKHFKDWKESHQTTSDSPPQTRVNGEEIQLNQQKPPGELQSLESFQEAKGPWVARGRPRSRRRVGSSPRTESKKSSVWLFGGGRNTDDPFPNKTRRVESSNPSTVFNISGGAESIQIQEGKANTDSISGVENFIPATPRKKEGKIYTRYTPSSLLGDVRGLLATGLLEGLPVKYKKDKVEVSGVVQDLGYKCGCSSCNYTKVVSANEFEKHAGVISNNQNNHIFLENGKTLYALVKDLRNIPLGSLGELIEEKIGYPANMKHFKDWKESHQTTSDSLPQTRVNGEEIQLNRRKPPGKLQSLESSLQPPTGDITGPASSNTTMLSFQQPTMQRESGIDLSSNTSTQINLLSTINGSPLTAINNTRNPTNMLPTVSHIKEKCSATESRSEQTNRLPPSLWLREPTAKPAQQKTAAEGGPKKRDDDLHRRIFMENGLPDGLDLAYCVKGEKVLGGYKSGKGIFCDHCEQEVSPSLFEAHAGQAARRQPYHNIYASNGSSLHEISISLLKGENLEPLYGMDECTVCGNGGDLFHCDGCRNAYHAACLDLEFDPEDKWYCSNCTVNFWSRRAASIMPSNAIKSFNLRLERIVDIEKDNLGRCNLCKDNSYARRDFGAKTILFCKQCWMEYHVGCLKDHGLCDLKEFPGENWLCSKECAAMETALQTLVHGGPRILPDYLLSLLNRKSEERGLMNEAGANVQWQLLSGNNFNQILLLAKATAIFHEAFEPIVARGCDIIPAMVFGKDKAGQYFRGMYCAVLTVKSVVVSAGVLRVFDRKLAELPLVATSKEFQKKGYFQALLSSIEILLRWLNVQFLIVHCGVDEQSMWINKLGFKTVTEEQLQAYRGHTVAFQKTIILGKAVPSVRTDGN